MGRLTDDMTRLVDEIAALHAERESFVQAVKGKVREMLAGFRKAHADRRAFVSNLRGAVAAMRAEFADDILGAHDAWFRSTPRQSSTPQSDAPSFKPKSRKR